jgi:hypothetical protein
MSNKEVFTAFAHNRVARGGNVRAERAETGTLVLYSYATPIAYTIDGSEWIFDERKYSVTTSKQVSQAKAVLPERCIRTEAHADFRAAVRELGVYLGMAR